MYYLTAKTLHACQSMLLACRQTIPWELTDIWVLGVETNHGGEVFPWTRLDLIDYMESVGYDWIGTAGIDDLFVRPERLQVSHNLRLFIQQHRKPQVQTSQCRSFAGQA